MSLSGRITNIVALFLLAIAALPAVATARVPGADNELGVALLASLREVAGLPGLSAAAWHKDRLMLAHATGVANADTGDQLTVTTPLPTASVAKMVTITAALRLVQRGAFEWDRPIREYLPDFADASGLITPRLLAAHLSGLPHYGPGSERPDRKYACARDALDVFEAAPRIATPGERYVYSTHGFTLLSAAMEAASHRCIADILESEVLSALGMTNAGLLDPARLSAAGLRLYRRSDPATVSPLPVPDLSYSWAGAGMQSTPSDLVRMASAYWDGTLSADAVASVFAEALQADGTGTGVGLGWRLATDAFGRRLLHHEGSLEGARSALLVLPDQHFAVALQTNIGWTAAMDSTARVWAEALLDADPTTADDRLAGRFVGDFDGTPVSGEWRLQSGRGYLETPAALRERFRQSAADAERLPLFHLHDRVYALVTPWGLFRLTLSGEGKRTRAEAALGSRRLQLRSDLETTFLFNTRDLS